MEKNKKNPRLYYFSFFFPCERSRAADCGAGCLPSEPSLHKEEKAKAELSQPSRPCSFSWLLPAWAEPKAQPQKSPQQIHCSLLDSFNPPWKSPLGVSPGCSCDPAHQTPATRPGLNCCIFSAANAGCACFPKINTHDCISWQPACWTSARRDGSKEHKPVTGNCMRAAKPPHFHTDLTAGVEQHPICAKKRMQQRKHACWFSFPPQPQLCKAFLC